MILISLFDDNLDAESAPVLRFGLKRIKKWEKVGKSVNYSIFDVLLARLTGLYATTVW